jgi:hypothetical protein
MMPLAPVPGRPQQYVRVIKTEEKGSDVNLATHLLHDAHRGKFEVAVIVSNDSDLLEPIKIVREELVLKVGILNPHKRPSQSGTRSVAAPQALCDCPPPILLSRPCY